MQLYVFGYGSLMNKESLARTVPSEKEITWVRVRGYQRKFNKRGHRYLYLNIVESIKKNVSGVLIPVDEYELELLKGREFGYDCVNISHRLVEKVDGIVYAFMAPDNHYPELKVSRRYIETCLGGLDPSQHKKWLKESILLNDIEEDFVA